MKNKVICCLLLASLIALLVGCASEPTPAPAPSYSLPEGYITAIGPDLYTAAEGGEYIRLTGINAGGWLLPEEWMQPVSLSGNLSQEDGFYDFLDALSVNLGAEQAEALYQAHIAHWWTEADFDNCRNMGCNVIRLPFGWRNLYAEDGTLKEDAFALLDWFVNEAGKRGMYTILDLHGAFGSQNGRHHSGVTRPELFYGDNALSNQVKTEALWVAVATHYRDNRWVAGYDLLNEPEGEPGGLTGEMQWDYFDRLYRAIREVDPNHLIVMEACWEASALPRPEEYGWQNVAYEYHYYNNNDQSQSGYELFMAGKLVLNRLLDYGVPIYVGEFSFGGDRSIFEWGLETYNKAGYSWTMWTYKVVCTFHGNWGVYYVDHRDRDNVALPTDSYQNILSKWSLTTADFTPHPWLSEVLHEFSWGNWQPEEEIEE